MPPKGRIPPPSREERLVVDQARADGAVDSNALLLTVPEAASLLRIGRNTCYELIRRGELPAVRLGERIIRIPRFGLEAWIVRETGLPSVPSPVVSFPPQRH